MTDTSRSAEEPRALFHRFEKAGVVVHDQPVPWNAESIVVEASLHLISPSFHNAADYRLEVSGLSSPIRAERLERASSSSSPRHRILFRLPPLAQAAEVQLYWRDRRLGVHVVPFLSREEFIRSLRMPLSGLYVRLGEDQVSCRAFVANQCRGLIASAALQSPTCLIPMLDLPLAVDFHNHRDNVTERVPLRLSAFQLHGRQTLLTSIPQKYPRKLGEWTATWRVADHPIEELRIRGVSQRELEKSIRVSATRYIIQSHEGSLSISRSPPAPGTYARLGPCFLVHHPAAGLAGLCPLQVRTLGDGSETSIFEENMLISDSLTMIMPGTLDAATAARLQSFELLLKGRSLARLPLGATPGAMINSEGGFNEVPEYDWSVAFDQELNERLSQLLEN